MNTQIPAWVNGTLTPVDKFKVHKQGLKHKAVSVFVIRGTDILLQRRALGKYHTPGLWANTCCTHPMWNEAPSTCAVRRLHEELGITGLYPEFRHHLEYSADVGNGMVENEAVDVFLAHVRDKLDVTPNPDEVMDTRWIDYHDLLAEAQRHPKRFTPWLKIYLRDYADTIFGPDLIIAAHSINKTG
ncbi:MAG: isopentenyl-diphosphate Delta-isomerase [Rhodobacteraceae bacterium]|nr:isopentenyl-diphosphate Delta-isomerase [Paracoccaceae bacterium]